MIKIFFIIGIIICIVGIGIYLIIKTHIKRLKHEHEREIHYRESSRGETRLPLTGPSPYSTIESVKDKPYDIELMTANSSDNKGKKDGK